MKLPTPPPLSFHTTTPQTIHHHAQTIQSNFHQAILAIKQQQQQQGTTRHRNKGAFRSLSRALGDASAASVRITLPSMVHADAEVRKASHTWKDEFKSMFDEVLSDRELYAKLLDDLGGDDENDNYYYNQNDEDARFQKNIIQTLRRNGCGLESQASRSLIQEKRRIIEQTCTAFCAAINEHDGTLLFTEEELQGVDGLERFPREEDTSSSGGGKKIKLTLKAPDTMPVLKFASNSNTRQIVNEALSKKCQEENTPRFLEVLELRHECATLLGYKSHAHYMCEVKMVKTPEKAEEFLMELMEAYQPICQRELKILLDMKRKDLNVEDDGVDNGDVKLDPWDVLYYTQLYKSQYAGVDEAALRNYFPLEHVKTTILEIYEELLGLKFQRVPDAEVWHEDVECYAVHDAATQNSNEEGEVLGHFYFDLYPRKGKYSHQCVYPLRPSYVRDTTNNNGGSDDSGSERILPASVNIGNLTPSRDGTPSLLLFRECETFFHEMGHNFHCILTNSRHSLHAWAWSAVPWPGGVEQDYLEVPSMMLENFVWCPEVLKRLSKHVSDGSCLPEETIEALSKSRYLMTGYGKVKYLAMALYDLKVHGGPGPYEFDGKEYDAVNLYNVMMEKYTGIAPIAGTFAAASWFHLLMGYDAGYYGYIYSEALAADLFAEFDQLSLENKPILDADLGKKYRDEILSPGATLDGDVMLRRFLGRDASKDAFLRRIIGQN